MPGSFAFALNYLVGNELDLRPLDAQFNNDEVGASAYDPRVMLKIVLLAYSQPSHTHIAKFVANLGVQIKPLFAQVLMTCDAQEMAISTPPQGSGLPCLPTQPVMP